MTSARALIVGLDGATFDVIDPLLGRGRMPTLAGLIARGSRARLATTVPPVSAPAWVTFLTGKHPGKHGVFNFQNLDARRYSGFSETLVNSSFFRGATLLDHLSRVRETRTLAYRIPMTFPPWEIRNGVVVSGPPVPDRRKAYATPASFAAELGTVSPFGHDELNAAQKGRDVAAIDACNRFELDLLEKTTARSLAAGTELVITFTGILDGLHHNFWYTHDPGSPLHEPDAAPALRTIVERWYERVDEMLGRLLAPLDASFPVMVISDHGGGPAPTRHVNLNAVLRAHGYLAAAGGGRAQVASGVRRLVDRARQQVPGRMWLKRNLPARVQRRLRGLRNATAAVAWDRTRAYAIPIFYPITGIWLNVAGRQARGTVAAGAEYERLRDELVQVLRAVTHPETGVPLVVGVWRREELYHGPHAEDAPDLVVRTAPGYHGGFDVEQVVTDVPLATLRAVNGSHTEEGIFVAAGGPFRHEVELDAPNLVDVLPTALHLVGAPLPDDLDGRVLVEALDPAFVAANPVQLVAAGDGGDGRVTLSQDDEQEMRKFLQGLGYVE